MTHKNLGPKTGTFEPPSHTEYEKKELINKINDSLCEDLDKLNTSYSELYNLMMDMVIAYESKNDKEMKILIKEYRAYNVLP